MFQFSYCKPIKPNLSAVFSALSQCVFSLSSKPLWVDRRSRSSRKAINQRCRPLEKKKKKKKLLLLFLQQLLMPFTHAFLNVSSPATTASRPSE